MWYGYSKKLGALSLLLLSHGILYAAQQTSRRNNLIGARVYTPNQSCQSCSDTVRDVKRAYKQLLSREMHEPLNLKNKVHADIKFSLRWQQAHSLYSHIVALHNAQSVGCENKKREMHALEHHVAGMLVYFMWFHCMKESGRYV